MRRPLEASTRAGAPVGLPSLGMMLMLVMLEGSWLDAALGSSFRQSALFYTMY